MKLDLKEFPNIGEDFSVVTIDLMMYEEGNYTPLINYMNTDEESEQVEGGLTLLTGMSFDSYQAAAIFFSALVTNGFFLPPVSRIGFILDQEGNLIEEINWEEYASPEKAPDGTSIH